MSKKNKRANKPTNKAAAPASTQPSVVVHQLTVKPTIRKVWDVGSWRSALSSADRGRTAALYDLFDDILIDGVLADALDKRISAVTNTPLTFVDRHGQEVEAVTELMDSLDWETLITCIMQARFWGRSALELSFGERLGCASIPSKHISLATRSILLDQGDERGIPYEEDPFLIVLGKERDYGLLLKAAPFIIYKRGGFGDWSQWIELFGMPQRVGKYNVHDPQSKKLLEDAMEAAGSASYLIAPSGTEIEHIETSNGNGSAYNDFRKACNEEVLITILGQTMTTIQGDKGARSLGEVHLEVEAGKHKSDLRFVQRVLNQYLKPRLEARGYPVRDGRFVYPEEAEHLSVAEIVQLSDIIGIPQQWLHDKYAIPMPEEGEPIARRTAPSLGYDLEAYEEEVPPAPAPKASEGNSKDEDTKAKDDQAPIQNSDSLWGRVRRFFGFAPRITLGAYKIYRPTDKERAIALADATERDAALIERIALSSGRAVFDRELFEWISGNLITALQRGYKRKGGRLEQADTTLSMQYSLQDDAFITAMEANLFRFSAGKTLSEVHALNQAFREAKNYSDFAARARRITTTYNHRWQRTEYNTALNCAQAASNYTELKRKAKLFPYWEYRTIGDDKVRGEHAALEGVILPQDDPKWDEIYPPNGWGCRCTVVPRMKHEVVGKVDAEEMHKRVEDYQASADWKSAKAQGWGVNRSLSAEVFDANQQYVHKLPRHSSSKIMELGHTDYGLNSIAKEITKEERPEIPTFEGDKWAWFEEHQVLTDYRGRNISFDRKVFESHTKGSYEKTRVPLLECISDVLVNPDEVWLNDYQGKANNINFIKFYQGRCINVVCELRDGKIYQVDTWFEIRLQYKNNLPQEVIAEEGKKVSRGKRDPKYKYRRGLLMYNKGD